MTTTKDRNLQFRGAPLIFKFLSSVQNVQKCARFPDGEKCVQSIYVSGCHGFSGPDFHTAGRISVRRKTLKACVFTLKVGSLALCLRMMLAVAPLLG